MDCPIYHLPICKDFKVKTFGIRSLQAAAAGVGREERDNFVKVFYWMSAVGKAMRKKKTKKSSQSLYYFTMIHQSKRTAGEMGGKGTINLKIGKVKSCVAFVALVCTLREEVFQYFRC